MSSRRSVLQGLAAAIALGGLNTRPTIAGNTSSRQKKHEGARAAHPSVTLKAADLIIFPGNVDCNSPAHWSGDTLYLFNSEGDPFRSAGPDLFHLSSAAPTRYVNKANGARWLEAALKDSDGTLYGWYHNEPHPICEGKPELTAPKIGALRSRDDGNTWEDLGSILEAPANSFTCATFNKYFVGGNGDFCVASDQARDYLYFFISTYNRDITEQGVAVCRMRYADRNRPVGKVMKYFRGDWNEPGIGGHVTPIIPVSIDWHQKNADAYWGPSIHWNSYLKSYVMLLNRAGDKEWTQQGVYISYNPDVKDVNNWSPPELLIARKDILGVSNIRAGWYPQVIGTDAKMRETDKLAGQTARLFIHGKSAWELVFQRAGE